ncbi:MAG: hypothetical protein ABIJ58_01395 [Nanoarchaeota archaeon]
MENKKAKWLKKPIPMNIEHYSKHGNIFIDDADCKISRDMKETLVLEKPKKDYHLHMGLRKSVITKQNKKGERRKERIILTKENFDNILKGGDVGNGRKRRK